MKKVIIESRVEGSKLPIVAHVMPASDFSAALAQLNEYVRLSARMDDLLEYASKLTDEDPDVQVCVIHTDITAPCEIDVHMDEINWRAYEVEGGECRTIDPAC